MSSDSNINMKNIEKLLSNLPENVLDIFSSLSKSDDSKGHELKSKEDLGNLEMLLNLKNMMDKFSNCSDTRTELIRALKPFLRPSRQEKLIHCLKALKISYFCKEASCLTTSQKQREMKGE